MKNQNTIEKNLQVHTYNQRHVLDNQTFIDGYMHQLNILIYVVTIYHCKRFFKNEKKMSHYLTDKNLKCFVVYCWLHLNGI